MMLWAKKKLAADAVAEAQKLPPDDFFLGNLPHDHYLIGFSSMIFSLVFSEIERTESASHFWYSPVTPRS